MNIDPTQSLPFDFSCSSGKEGQPAVITWGGHEYKIDNLVVNGETFVKDGKVEVHASKIFLFLREENSKGTTLEGRKVTVEKALEHVSIATGERLLDAFTQGTMLELPPQVNTALLGGESPTHLVSILKDVYKQMNS